MSPSRRFPFKADSASSPISWTGLPLSPHLNPLYMSCEQSRGFPRQPLTNSLASFAKQISCMTDRQIYQWPTDVCAKYAIPSYFTQGRLRCNQFPGMQVFQYSPKDRRIKPPRNQGQRPHAIVDRPNSLLPGPTQSWALRANPTNFIDVPSSEFLASPSRTVDRLEYCTTRNVKLV